jgi:transcriptional regulator with XRE-family HTH domain
VQVGVPRDKQRRREAFGARLRQLREEQGLSQETLAHTAGLHRTYVGSVERGERNISLDAIYALSDALHVSAADLMP